MDLVRSRLLCGAGCDGDSVDLLIDAMESLLAWNASRRDEATG